jgi:putative ABC transport system permease protein
MTLLEIVRVALRGLRANRLRTGLTMLGIAIGVGAVILLVAVGTGSSKAVSDRINKLGTNTLTIFSQGGARSRSGQTGTGTATRTAELTTADVKALQDTVQNPDIATVAPVVSASSITGTYNGSTHSPATFTGTTPNYADIRDYKVAAGNFFTDADVDSKSRVVVLGQTVVSSLFGNEDPIGKTVTFGTTKFTVIGVLSAKGSDGQTDSDDIVFAPYTTVQETLTGRSTSLSQIIVQAASSKKTDAASAEVTATLRTTHKLSGSASNNFQVLNQASLLETSNSTNRVFTVLLGAVAAISLLVGGIGVMNIMLVTVTERTREIGIRKAIGAKKADILGQFLVEAVLVSVLGGLAGVMAGLVGSRFTIVGVHPVVAPYSIALAFGVAVAVGLFFGMYPANRAAALRPIDALRHE